MSDKPMMLCGHVQNAVVKDHIPLRLDGADARETEQRELEPDKPACAICQCTTVIDAALINLSGRIAKCSMCEHEVPSLRDLAFFQFRGEGSYAAAHTCNVCRYNDRGCPINQKRTGKIHDFEPHGAFEFDVYYDGCRG